MPAYKAVFIATGIGMLISFFWFWFGRRSLGEIGRPPAGTVRWKYRVALGRLAEGDDD